MTIHATFVIPLVKL